MAGYQKMYITVFNAVTQALEELEKQNLGAAKECLLSAQLMAGGGSICKAPGRRRCETAASPFRFAHRANRARRLYRRAPFFQNARQCLASARSLSCSAVMA